MVETDDVDGEEVGHVLCRDVFGGDHVAYGSRTRDKDIDLAHRADDLGHAWEVGLRGGVCFDFDVGVGGFEGFLRIVEDLLAALDDDDAANACFGEGLADGVTDAGCW